ncbi:unnamed protein product [Dicrocoelium dendriticum]|nr:unnamed protein product [Dicrocoelium dendriticum]
MGDTRSNFDRGPPDFHISDRFSTTYSSSYRPFTETRKNVELHCGTHTKPTTSFVNGSVSTTPQRGSRAWSSDLSPYVDPANAARSTNPPSGQPSANRTLAAIDCSDNVGVRRLWDDLVSLRFDPQRPKPSGLSVSGTPINRAALRTHDISSGANCITGSSLLSLGPLNKNYTSTYTTTVTPDNSDPSFSASRDPICDKAVQAVNPSSPGLSSQSQRALNSGTTSVTPKADSHSELPLSKKTASSREPNLSVNPATLFQPATYNFDYGQMFSQIARINSHLYLSSLSALTPDRLRQHGITLLVSAMVDAPPLQLRNAVSSSLHVAVEDMEGANLRVHFDRVGDRIAAEHRRGGRVLVHCMAGMSRSSTLVLAYLVRHMNMSLADAYQHVRSIRPCIQPNPSFWRQLLEYEERVRGSRSVRLLPLDYMSSCSITPTNRLLSNGRVIPRTSYLDLYSRSTGDLLPYRPLTSLYSIDSGKPYIGCRQPLG